MISVSTTTKMYLFIKAQDTEGAISLTKDIEKHLPHRVICTNCAIEVVVGRYTGRRRTSKFCSSKCRKAHWVNGRKIRC